MSVLVYDINSEINNHSVFKTATVWSLFTYGCLYVSQKKINITCAKSKIYVCWTEANHQLQNI